MRTAKLWDSFIQDSQILRTYFVLSDAINLYREALLCYDAKAHMATCMCVRSSMEAALHAARRTRNLNAPQVHRPKSAQVSLSDTKWKRLLHWASNTGLLDKNLEGRVRRARKLGDLGAHLAQRKARAYIQQMKVIRRRPGASSVVDQTLAHTRRCFKLALHMQRLDSANRQSTLERMTFPYPVDRDSLLQTSKDVSPLKR